MSDYSVDQAKDIRSGEELNLEKLTPYLNEKLGIQGNIEIHQFPSGFSNLTYLIKLGDKEMVLRRPPYGAENINKGHDMGREFNILKTLQPVYPKVPKPIIFVEDTSIIGAPFYLMERVQGVILRANQVLNLDEKGMRKLNENFIDNLADLHLLDIDKTGLSAMGKTDGYMERQVEGWIKRYQNSKTDEIKEMEEVIGWFSKNIPQTQYNCFIHNDYKYDNVVLNPDDITEIKAVLDWEMSTIGDALSDFATSLAYTPEKDDPAKGLKSFNIAILPGAMNRDEMVAYYEAKTGRKVHDLIFYYSFAIFKLGVIMQQIYFRYHKGFTKDPRFAPLIYLVKDCALMSSLSIKTGKIRNF